ncbi:MAG: TolC family protein [Leptospira sp.]|nr:TolC family protein [Leptospira sp.]
MRRVRLSEWENPTLILPDGSNKKKLNLSIEEAVRYVIANNITVQNAKYEILTADSPELKNETQFAWKAIGGVTVFRQLLPVNNANLFAGNKLHRDRITGGIDKMFRTGTYFKVEAYTERFDSSAFEDPITTPQQFRILGIPPLYTGGLSFTLSQELYKYSFGESQERTEKILKNQTKLKRDEMIDILTQLVVSVLVDYWSLAIYDSQVTTYEKLLKNTEEIRNLTLRKRALGLSESYDVNKWNSNLASTKSLLEKAKLERIQKERDLIRILNVDPNSSISGVTDLRETGPPPMDLKKDIEYALKNRLDLIRVKRSQEMAELGLENALEEDKPSVKASVSYGSIDQNFEAPQMNWIVANKGVYAFYYPQLYAEMKVDYPLWNEEIKAEINAAKLDSKDLKIAEQELVANIKDEIKDRYDNINMSYKVLQETLKSQDENQKYYNQLLVRFRQGRFDAVTIKTALDALVQTDLAVIQAKINYNINLLRYDLAKNYVFEKYGVNIYRILAEAEKEAQKMDMPSSGSLFDDVPQETK